MSRAIPLFVIFGCLIMAPGCVRETTPTMGVAASLREVMPELVRTFEKTGGRVAPKLSFGASGTLSKQLEAGAPMSAVVLASAEAIDSLIERGLLEPNSRAELARNTLVLAGRAGERAGGLSEMGEGDPQDRIAMGDPRFVPAGRHAQELLESRGLWGEISRHTIFTRDVTAAVALLRRGEVKRALIYETDVRHHEDLEVLDSLVDPKLKRPVVIAARAPHSESLSPFFSFLRGPRAATIFETHGFEVAQR